MFQTEEYGGVELFLGGLVREFIAYGENPKLSSVLKKKLVVVGDIETKKCAILAIASGAERAPQGQPKRCPPRRRIDGVASGLRLGEFLVAERENMSIR